MNDDGCRLFRTLRGTLVQLQEKCQQYNRLAQDLQITSDEALDFEFKLRERESYLESEIQVGPVYFCLVSFSSRNRRFSVVFREKNILVFKKKRERFFNHSDP